MNIMRMEKAVCLTGILNLLMVKIAYMDRRKKKRTLVFQSHKSAFFSCVWPAQIMKFLLYEYVYIGIHFIFLFVICWCIYNACRAYIKTWALGTAAAGAGHPAYSRSSSVHGIASDCGTNGQMAK